MSSTGSGILQDSVPTREHLTRGSSGLGGEINDLRNDIKSATQHMASIVVEEWTNPAATSATGLKNAAATVADVVTYTAADLKSAGKADMLANPRTITFTTAGVTPADAPANVVITGTDVDGNSISETLSLAQVADIVESVKAYKTITSLVFPAAQGTAATIAIGLGTKLGLRKKLKSRAGLATCIKEIAAGAVVTNGVFTAAATSAPNGLYAPNANPDGSKDYCIYYESDES